MNQSLVNGSSISVARATHLLQGLAKLAPVYMGYLIGGQARGVKRMVNYIGIPIP
ncbi:MAG: hypothetical protein VX434_00135 [Pseudomonadota bacterium]|nr:hypothetical protein [Pseudomonadota bacterium]